MKLNILFFSLALVVVTSNSLFGQNNALEIGLGNYSNSISSLDNLSVSIGYERSVFKKSTVGFNHLGFLKRNHKLESVEMPNARGITHFYYGYNLNLIRSFHLRPEAGLSFINWTDFPGTTVGDHLAEGLNHFLGLSVLKSIGKVRVGIKTRLYAKEFLPTAYAPIHIGWHVAYTW